MRYASGNFYDGEWQNNVKHGKGTMIWKDRGEMYTGSWEVGYRIDMNTLGPTQYGG
jgi:hypothetical protein